MWTPNYNFNGEILMPYIPKILRPEIDKLVYKCKVWIRPDGTLNYFITKLFVERFKTTDMSYREASLWIAELECCKLELYRKYISPYEDKKERLNGTVK